MGSITVSVSKANPLGSKTYTVPNADIDRLIAWAKVFYAPQPGGVLTDAQALLAWVNAFMEATKARVTEHEREAAIKAVPEPVPISAT
jgi:hypothetical protein